MQHLTDDIGERELARALAGGWGLAAAALRYVPVGFGDHHWELTDTSGGRWFVTVAALAGGWRGAGPAEGLADLRAALGTVTALRQAGLEFAVAPVPTQTGQPLVPLGPGHAVTGYPWLDGAAGGFGEPHPGNVFRSRSGALHLIDWDTAGLALPERDLWDVAGPGSAEAAQYTALTGRPVSPVAAEAYRIRWALDDIRLAGRDFHGPHERTPDTELTWTTLGEELARITG